jgi:hypothetical protein
LVLWSLALTFRPEPEQEALHGQRRVIAVLLLVGLLSLMAVRGRRSTPLLSPHFVVRPLFLVRAHTTHQRGATRCTSTTHDQAWIYRMAASVGCVSMSKKGGGGARPKPRPVCGGGGGGGERARCLRVGCGKALSEEKRSERTCVVVFLARLKKSMRVVCGGGGTRGGACVFRSASAARAEGDDGAGPAAAAANGGPSTSLYIYPARTRCALASAVLPLDAYERKQPSLTRSPLAQNPAPPRPGSPRRRAGNRRPDRSRGRLICERPKRAAARAACVKGSAALYTKPVLTDQALSSAKAAAAARARRPPSASPRRAPSLFVGPRGDRRQPCTARPPSNTSPSSIDGPVF